MPPIAAMAEAAHRRLSASRESWAMRQAQRTGARPAGSAAARPAEVGQQVRHFSPVKRHSNAARASNAIVTMRNMALGRPVDPVTARWLIKEGYMKRSGNRWKPAGEDALKFSLNQTGFR